MAIRDATQESNGNAEPALVASSSAVGAAFFVVPESLLEPNRRIDAGRMCSQRSLDRTISHDSVDDDRIDVLATHEKVGRLSDRVALALRDEADAGHGE